MMADVSDINSKYNQLRRSANETDKIYRDLLEKVSVVATDSPSLEVIVLADYLLRECLDMMSKHWLLATKYRLINLGDMQNAGVEVSSILLGQDPKPVVKYVGAYLTTPYIGPTVGWDVVDEIKSAWVKKYAEVVQPMSLFIYAGIKWFFERNWALISNTAKPGDLDFSWQWLSPDRTYIITMDVNYSTIPADAALVESYAKDKE